MDIGWDEMSRLGHDALWAEMSYTSWLTLPRSLMHEMPDEWQNRMAALLKEYFDHYDFTDIDLGTRVLCTRNNRLVKTPPFILNYRHPERRKIKSLFAKSTHSDKTQ